MRRPRLLAPPESPSAVYHCISRVVDRRFAFGPPEKDLFRQLMQGLAEFCGVRILTYCLMSNHFHILVEVPRPPDPLPSTEETLESLARLSGEGSTRGLRQWIEDWRRAGDGRSEELWRARVHSRRWNLSRFVGLLKQRFSRIYNRSQGRKGTLWEERFRSVLVQGEGRALVTMAAYIDLNPVRAGAVSDPAEYRWSGYGAAVAGEPLEQEGLGRLTGVLCRREAGGDEDGLGRYRRHLDLESVGRSAAGDSRMADRRLLLRTLAEKGLLSTPEYLRCRVRYFSDGGALGSREFVESIFLRNRNRFGLHRRSGARRLKGLADRDLFSLRALRVGVFG